MPKRWEYNEKYNSYSLYCYAFPGTWEPGERRPIAVLRITEYIVKLERENCGLKEYKKHQERANERRYRSGEESWHRGSVVAKKK